MNDFLTAWSPRVLSILRIITGFLFVWHGTQKLFGYPPRPGGGGGSLDALMLTAGILEFAGGLLFILGLFTRPTAFIMSGLMAVAYFMAHGTQAFLPIVNGGELAALYSFVFLYFVFAGAGEWSLDRLMGKRAETI